AARQTVVSYSVNTTSLGAAEATKSVLPKLRLSLGDQEIPAVYTHTVQLTHGGGPELDRASVGITLAGARLLGNIVSFGPDPVHQITCKFDQTISSVACSVGRISPDNNPYKVIIATDQDPKISLSIDA